MKECGKETALKAEMAGAYRPGGSARAVLIL